jgi:hypothetical protein
VADPIAELVWAMLLCSGKTLFRNYIRERRGDDWKKYLTYTRFISNPDENITEFWPGGLKRLEML